jgi:beta-lactamase regulating signal transducer with metallopeptidase domain
MSPTIVEMFNGIGANWSRHMLAVLWQSTVLIAAAAFMTTLLRRNSPQVRFWIWQIVAVKLLVMPFWTLGAPLPAFLSNDPTDSTIEAVSIDSSGHAVDALASPEAMASSASFAPGEPTVAVPLAPARPSLAWTAWLFLIWGLIVACQTLRLFIQRVRLARLLRSATPADGGFTALVKRCSERIGLRHPPSVILIETEGSVFVAGLRRPVLVFPRGLTSLDRDELSRIVLHELAHVKRRDLFWGWFVEFARIIYFFHPLVYWVRYRLWLERELACDQLAMSASGAGPREYVDTLVRVITRISTPQPAIGTVSAGLDGNHSFQNGGES